MQSANKVVPYSASGRRSNTPIHLACVKNILNHFGYFVNSDFQKIIRDLSCISDKIEIKSVATNDGAELIFKCGGGFAQAEVRRAESDGGMEYLIKQDNSKIIQGEFSLKNLGYFIKCTNLCNQIGV